MSRLEEIRQILKAANEADQRVPLPQLLAYVEDPGLSVTIPGSTKTILYSGRYSQTVFASEVAEAITVQALFNGTKIARIDDTELGRLLLSDEFKTAVGKLAGSPQGTKDLLSDTVDGFWSVASKRFVDAASGEVITITPYARFPQGNSKGQDGVFGAIELEALRRNPNITHVNGLEVQAFTELYAAAKVAGFSDAGALELTFRAVNTTSYGQLVEHNVKIHNFPGTEFIDVTVSKKYFSPTASGEIRSLNSAIAGEITDARKALALTDAGELLKHIDAAKYLKFVGVAGDVIDILSMLGDAKAKVDAGDYAGAAEVVAVWSGGTLGGMVSAEIALALVGPWMLAGGPLGFVAGLAIVAGAGYLGSEAGQAAVQATIDTLRDLSETPAADFWDGLVQGILDAIPGPDTIPSWLLGPLNHYLGAAQTFAFDPLVVDLDGDGIEMISLAASQAQFDIDGDGLSERMGWVGPDDGLLVIDRNHDGTINDISELIGNAFESGFTILRALDANGDDVINAADGVFGDLLVWRDANGNGHSDAGELFSLSAFGISSINLNTTSVNLDLAGNLISETSTFLFNGSPRQIVSAWFAVNQTLSAYDPGSTFSTPYELDLDTIALPQLKGSGAIVPLFMAASGDTELKSLLQQFTDRSAGQLIGAASAIEQILFRWAGTEDAAQWSRGTQFDAKVIEFLEAYFGQDYVQQLSLGGGQTSNPSGPAVPLLESAYRSLFEALGVRLLIQGPLADVFGDVSQDTISGALSTSISSADLTEDLFESTSGLPSIAVLSKIALGALVLRYLFPNDQDLANDLTTRVADFANENGWSEFVGALTSKPILAVGSSLHYAAQSGSAFVAGSGNETLRGSVGNDLYLFGSVGEVGLDTIDESGGFDAIVFAEGVAPADVRLRGTSNGDLYLALADNDDTILIRNQLNPSSSWARVEEARFADGTVLSLIGGLTFLGTENDDILSGSPHADVIEGFGGADTLSGDGGSDVIRGGSGNDRLDGEAGSDSLYGGDDDDVLFGYLLIFTSTEADFLYGEKGKDRLYGAAGNDVLDGGEGDDIEIVGGGGDDRLIGGPGNDLLNGDEGNDRYEFARGDGFDTISEDGDDDLDAIVFAAGIAPTDVLLQGVSNGDLYLRLAGTSDAILIRNQMHPSFSWARVEEVRFADGTVWDLVGGLIFLGTENDDSLSGSPGADVIEGFGGADRLSGSGGNDIIRGGSGNDRLDGEAGSDSLYGGDDDDTLFAYLLDLTSTAAEFLYGEKGKDRLYGAAGNDVLDGGEGDDIEIFGGRGDDRLIGGPGNDLLGGDEGNDRYEFARGDGFDTINEDGDDDLDAIVFAAGIAPADVRLQGVSNGDLYLRLAGTSDAILIRNQMHPSFSWARVEEARFADGTVWNLIGGLTFLGTENNDVLSGSPSADVIEGFGGADTLSGSGGNDIIRGGSGNDRLDGEAGSDSLYGGDDDDVLFGYLLIFTSTEADFLYGEKGKDRLYGTAGNDVLDGGEGDDIEIVGGGGDDRLIGGPGNDLLGGDEGNDRYEFARGDGFDTISEDGDDDLDAIVFAAGIAPADVVLQRVSNADLYLRLAGTSDTILIRNQLHPSFSWARIEEVRFADGTVWDLINRYFIGSENADDIDGTPGSDIIDGLGGNDSIDGGAGNDSIEGGLGEDRVVFSGHRIDYRVNVLPSGAIQVVDLRSTSADGNDTIRGVENFIFSDGIFNATTVLNDAPTVSQAIPDQASPEDQHWSYQVSATAFADPDGDTLSYTVTLADGAALPNWLTFDETTRMLSGKPPQEFSGSLDLKVTAHDGSLTSSQTFVLSITPANDVPTAPSSNNVTTAEDTASAAAAIGASDLDGDTLAYMVKSGAEPAKGTVTFSGGSFVYTPNANANGSDSFTILVSDGYGGTAEQTVSVTITPVNDVPAAPSSNSVTTAEDTASAAVAIGASDLDGDTLAYVVKSGAEPAKGAVTFGGGSFVYTPNPNANGSDGFTILVSDGNGGAAQQTVSVTITPVNDMPAAVALTNMATSLAENTSTATRIKVADIVVTDDELGANTLAVIGTDAAFFEIDGTRLFLKAGTTLNLESKSSYAFTVTADDPSIAGAPDATSAPYTLSLTNVNETPLGATLSSNTIAENSANGTAVGTIAGVDVDAGSSFGFSLQNNTGGRFAINAASGVITVANSGLLDYEQAVSHDVVVRVTDQGGLFRDTTFTIDVTDVAPVIPGDDVANSLTGTPENDTLNGMGGNDTLNGLGNNDTLIGGLGADQLDGGDGTDIADYSTAFGGVTVDLATPELNTGDDAAGDSFISIEGLRGSASSDVLRGDGAANVLDGGNGPDVMAGRGGDDIYYVDNINDLVTENVGDGNDTVYSTISYNLPSNVESLIFLADPNGTGGTGADPVFTGIGNALANVMTGNAFNDTFFSEDGADTLSGGGGDDVLVAHTVAGLFAQDADTLSGGEGNDTLYGEAADALSGGSGFDVLQVINDFAVTLDLVAVGIEYVVSGFGNDTYLATAATTTIEAYGGGGNDSITGGSGNDNLWAGVGNDTLVGNDGNDLLVGDLGADSLSGGAGSDRLYIDSDDTFIDGGDGFDAAYITTGTGRTLNLASSHIEWVADFVGGNDTIDGSGSTVNLEIYAAGGTDSVIGGSGADFVWGEAGNDTLSGNGGNDTLVGGIGSDRITGGTGTDALYGNSGNGGDGAIDTFVFTDGSGTDFVFDFEHGVDKLDLSAVTGVGSIADLTITSTSAGHCYVSFGGNLIALAGMAGQITQSDFFF